MSTCQIKTWICGILLAVCSNSLFAQNYWQGMDFPLVSSVRTFYSDTSNNLFYAGGRVPMGGGAGAPGVVVYDDTAWVQLPSSGIWPVSAITKYKNEIYIAGAASVGQTIKKWNGVSYDTLNSVINGTVGSFYEHDNELYVMGVITQIDTTPVNGIAKWDGNSWTFLEPIDNVISYGVSCAIHYNGELYIGGNFYTTDWTIQNIAKWDGTNWQPVGGGFVGGLASVAKLVEYKGELYAAGTFSKTESPANPGNYIAKWNGNQWSDVGGGVIGVGGGNGQISDMVIYNNELYVVGVFSYAGGVEAEYVAKWDGTEWCGFGNDFNNTIGAIGVYNGELYIGGAFYYVDGDTTTNIVKWTGGNFVDTCGVIITGVKEEFEVKNEELQIYPNPIGNEGFNVLYELSRTAYVHFRLFDYTGKEIITIYEGYKPVGKYIEHIDTSPLFSGMYFLIANINGQIQTFKVIKL